ncbi:MAG: hypothetical protein H7Z75_19380 [Ferruginibacter sp.]|nr:hypothetical protein [Cytophagales bacterium]
MASGLADAPRVGDQEAAKDQWPPDHRQFDVSADDMQVVTRYWKNKLVRMQLEVEKCRHQRNNRFAPLFKQFYKNKNRCGY